MTGCTKIRLVSFRRPLCPCPCLLPSTMRPGMRKTNVLTGAMCSTVAKSFKKLRLSRLCASGVMLRRKRPLTVQNGTGTNRGIAISVTGRGLATGTTSGKS